MMPWLNKWLLGGDRSGSEPVETEVNKRTHPVPNGPKEMQGSQNLFLLEAGCDAAIHGQLSPGLEKELIVRLQKERDEVGLWGSECTSPIYHHFAITGWTAIYHNTNNETLKSLIEQNLASFFWYALCMGLGYRKHGLIGMRGTGHDFSDTGFPDLHFVCQYHTTGRTKDFTKLSSWKPMLRNSGWAYSGVAGGMNYELYKKVFELAVDDTWKPWKLRSKLTLIRGRWKNHPPSPVAHFYARGINGNTPCLIGYVESDDPTMIGGGGYLPTNCSVRVRQKQDDSSCVMRIENDMLVLQYFGLYTSLLDSPVKQIRSYGPLTPRYLSGSVVLEMMTSDLSGVSGWTQIYPSPAVPVEQPPSNTHIDPPVKKRKRWWEFWK